MKKLLVFCLLCMMLVLCACEPTPSPVANIPSPTPPSHATPPPTPPSDDWRTVTLGLPRRDLDRSLITQCNDTLYLLYGIWDNEQQLYVLEDFRWVPLASFQAHVGAETVAIADVYAYDNMLFVEGQQQTHIQRADGSWFSIPSLNWLDSGRYYISEVANQHAADGLYATSATYGKVFRFENEAWAALPKLPAFEHVVLQHEGGWTFPDLFTCGEDLYVHCGTTNNGALIYRLTSNGWRKVTGPADIHGFADFEGKLHIATKNRKIYRQDPGGWVDLTQDVTDGGREWDVFSFVVHEDTLYLNMNQNLYRREIDTWTPLEQGLPPRDETCWRDLYSTEMGLLLGGYTNGFYRLCAESWERMTGEPWDTDDVYQLLSSNGVSFARASSGLYRLHSDGTAERTLATGIHGNGDCDILHYKDGYIDEYVDNRILLRLNGQDVLLEDGLPKGDLDQITCHQVGQEVYAISGGIDARLFYWAGTRWREVAMLSGEANYNFVVFDDTLYVCAYGNVLRVVGGEITPTRGAFVAQGQRLMIADDELYLFADGWTLQLVEGLYWQVVQAAD